MASPAKRKSCDVSRELMDAITREDWTEVKNILSESSHHVADILVTQLINENRWGAVRRIIISVGDEECTWNIEGNVMKNNILLSVAKRDWTCLKESPSERFPDSTFRWIIRQACTRATESEVIQLVLFRCADDRLTSVLTILVEQRLWTAVGRALARSVSDSTKQWAVREACGHCKQTHFGTYSSVYWSSFFVYGSLVEQCLIYNILPHCADNQLDSVLTTLVERRLWQAVLYVLMRGVNDSSKRWVVLEVCACCESVSQEKTLSDILLFCADDQTDCVLTTLVEQRQWIAVGTILRKGVSDSNKQWAVREACERCEEDDFGTFDSRWYLLSQSNQEYDSPNEQCLVDDILPHCADNQLGGVLTTLVERRLWQAVLYVLKRGVSASSKRWVVLEVCACCDSVSQERTVSDILLCCAEDQADSVLTTLVEQRLWIAVGRVLKKGVSDSYKQWAVQQACKQPTHNDVSTCNTHWCSRTESDQKWYSPTEQCLVNDILPHCADNQLDSVLTTLVKRRLWIAVGEVLKKGVSDSNKQWAVREAWTCFTRYHCGGDGTLPVILRHCDDNQLESVLTTLVERGLWKPVGEILQRGVSDTQRRWAVEEASKNAKQEDFVQCILPFCLNQHLDSVLLNLVKRRLWKSVGELLQLGVGKTQRRWAVEEEISKAAKSDDFYMFVLSSCSHQHLRIVPYLVENGMWDYVQQILHCTAKHFLFQLVTREGHTIKDDSVVWALPNNCHLNAAHAVKLFGVAKKETARKVHELHTRLGLKEDLCDLLYTSYLHQVCFELFNDHKNIAIMTDSTRCLVFNIYKEIISCIQTISTNSAKDMVDYFKLDACKITTLVATLSKLSSNSARLFYPFLEHFSLYYTYRQGNADDEVLLMMFAVLPLVPEMQSVALRIMLRHKRWDVISQADLSGVWEQDRRHLLQAAVKQRQWSVVKRWADHTLYDDQRVWALNEALNEKQWDVALLLADHGLTDIDLMRVHYRLAKYADWDVILHMFERGADVEEVKERLGRMKDNKRISEMSLRFINIRHGQVKNLVKEMQKAKADALEIACYRCNWMFVLFTLIRNHSNELAHCALKAAMKKKAWHVVMQLVRLGIDAKQRHSLFSRMMKRRQWGVCRVLLEQGLSVQLCLKVLPQLMEMNQWSLVARVMEHEVGDDVRQQVMQRAWERREGSVVWLCIKSLPTPLSVKEREALFQRAFSCELWQVIKPLVEEKDETGIRHRDTALLEAIDQHEWDLVDHCQRHHADINMKDNDGHTPLQRVAMKEDWEAVEELVVRDGDPNLMDREGYTVLHRAIKAKHWDIVNLLIQYQADIHKEFESSSVGMRVTPLGMLINTRRVDMIELTLLWCPNQDKGLNSRGETPLHVACLSGCYDSIYYLMARGVPPLAVTLTGQSGLVYAVLNKDCPQRMVAECIRLGFSTHQPKLTNIETDQTCLMPHYLRGRLTWLEENRITSPFLCAVLHSVPTLMQMLYESGACSQREMFRLYTQLYILADTTTKERRKVQALAGHQKSKCQNFERCIADALPYLTEIATTPRSLVSTCRLVISHCLTLSKTRHRDVDQLPLTERMKNFVLFSDLTDPDFGKDTT